MSPFPLPFVCERDEGSMDPKRRVGALCVQMVCECEVCYITEEKQLQLTCHPRVNAAMETALTTGFNPGQSPPQVITPIFLIGFAVIVNEDPEEGWTFCG